MFFAIRQLFLLLHTIIISTNLIIIISTIMFIIRFCYIYHHYYIIIVVCVTSLHIFIITIVNVYQYYHLYVTCQSDWISCIIAVYNNDRMHLFSCEGGKMFDQPALNLGCLGRTWRGVKRILGKSPIQPTILPE